MKKKKAIIIENLEKKYENDFHALKNISLEINEGEIFALLGPNGAGKTTMIGIICGIIKRDSGNIKVFDYDIIKEYRKARSLIGLVPQELTTDSFETVFNTVKFSRGLFGKRPSSEYLKLILNKLSLWEKKDSQIRKLSGGMKRRVMIAKALSHEPSILFLDEPSAGVDVELRESMWREIRELRKTGVTIILTTHYIKEAEEIADRISIINEGKIILTQKKDKLLKKLGNKRLTIDFKNKINNIPRNLAKYNLKLINNGKSFVFDYKLEKPDLSLLMNDLRINNLIIKDLDTKKSSLEEIYVKLIENEF